MGLNYEVSLSLVQERSLYLSCLEELALLLSVHWTCQLCFTNFVFFILDCWDGVAESLGSLRSRAIAGDGEYLFFGVLLLLGGFALVASAVRIGEVQLDEGLVLWGVLLLSVLIDGRGDLLESGERGFGLGSSVNVL